MQVTKTKVAPCTYKLRIEVEADDVGKAFRRAWREFAERTPVPGFRPGKVPRPILERHVDETRLRERVMQILAGPAYREALEHESIEPLDDPELEFGDLVDGEPWAFEATVAVAPVVTLGDVTGVEVERPIIPVSEEDIARSLEALRQENPIEIPIVDRGAAEGDVIFADVAVQMEGEPPDKPVTQRLIVGRMIPDLDKGLIGLTTGETREIPVRFPDDYPQKEQAGREATVTVTAHSIVEHHLPEPTDAWVQQIGAAESLEDFRNKERERLQRRVEEIAEDVVRSRAVELLVERSTVEYPPALLDVEEDNVARRLSAELEQNQMTYDQYLEAAGMTREQHEESMAAEADRRVRLRLVLREFARRENLDLSEEAIANATEFSRRLVSAGGAPDGRTADDQARVILNRMLYARIGDRLKEMVKIVDKEVAPSEAEEAKAGEGDAEHS